MKIAVSVSWLGRCWDRTGFWKMNVGDGLYLKVRRLLKPLKSVCMRPPLTWKLGNSDGMGWCVSLALCTHLEIRFRVDNASIMVVVPAD